MYRRHPQPAALGETLALFRHANFAHEPRATGLTNTHQPWRQSFRFWKMTTGRWRSSRSRATANFISILQDNTGQHDNSHRPWRGQRSLDGTEWQQYTSSFEKLCAAAYLPERPLQRSSNRTLSRKMRGTSIHLSLGRGPAAAPRQMSQSPAVIGRVKYIPHASKNAPCWSVATRITRPDLMIASKATIRNDDRTWPDVRGRHHYFNRSFFCPPSPKRKKTNRPKPRKGT